MREGAGKTVGEGSKFCNGNFSCGTGAGGLKWVATPKMRWKGDDFSYCHGFLRQCLDCVACRKKRKLEGGMSTAVSPPNASMGDPLGHWAADINQPTHMSGRVVQNNRWNPARSQTLDSLYATNKSTTWFGIFSLSRLGVACVSPLVALDDDRHVHRGKSPVRLLR